MTDPMPMKLPPAPDLPGALLSYQRQNLFCDVALQFCLGESRSGVDRRGTDDASVRRRLNDGGVVVSLPAHKVVLAAAGQFFRDAIEETQNDVIEIPSPVDEHSLKTIVEWIYGGLGEIEASQDSLARLAAVGEALQLFPLVDAIRDRIGRNNQAQVGDSFEDEAEEAEEQQSTADRDDLLGQRDSPMSDDVEIKEEVEDAEINGGTHGIEDASGLINAPSLFVGETKDAKVIVDAKKGRRRAKDRRRSTSRKKLNREPPKPAVVVKPIDIRSDPILSPQVDAHFVFRCREPACDEVIRRDSPGCAGLGNLRLFSRRCAKHLWVHHRIVCPNVYSQCKEPNCGYAGLETDLARHTNFKHRKEKIPCSVCGKLVQENSLKNHIDLIHKGAKELFPCPTCGKSFSRKHFLTLHENSVHKKGDEHVRRCDLCDYETAYKPMLVQHSFTKHNIMMPGAKLLTCDICGVFKTPLLKLLNRHKKRKRECNRGGNGDAAFPCEECGKTFRGPYEVKTHQRRMHQDGDVGMCPVCGEVFRSKSGLKYHLWRVHHQGNNGFAAADVQFRLEKPFRCAYCPHASGLSGNCRKHVMRAHPGMEVKYVDLRTIATAEERLAAVSFPTATAKSTIKTTKLVPGSELLVVVPANSSPSIPAASAKVTPASTTAGAPAVVDTADVSMATGAYSIDASTRPDDLLQPSFASLASLQERLSSTTGLSCVPKSGVFKIPPQTIFTSLHCIHPSSGELRLVGSAGGNLDSSGGGVVVDNSILDAVPLQGGEK